MIKRDPLAKHHKNISSVRDTKLAPQPMQSVLFMGDRVYHLVMSRRGLSTSASTPQAQRHARVRDAHACETAEDYVEAIAKIIKQSGCCRVCDLASRFGVSHVTVSKTIARLAREGLVKTEPYKPIKLTARGRQLAVSSSRRHQIVVAFLIALGLDKATAELDAEGIEHHVSPQTLKLFEAFAQHQDTSG